jgi:MSHA biogenesis protein MshL
MFDFYRILKSAPLWLGVLLLAGCANERTLQFQDVTQTVREELPAPRQPAQPVAVPQRVTEALAEPAPAKAPPVPEPRIDLLVNNAQAREVFLAIVADTRYSMLMHPDVKGTLSVTLRGVTVTEALEAIRDVYGYDFKIDGRRITIYAPTLQTRIFTINYPQSQRSGTSELSVSSGTVSGSSGGATNSGAGGASGAGAGGASGGATSQVESSRISTNTKTDYWAELTAAVKGMVGPGDGRSVITSPQAGIMAVRAMPDELRQVEKFLKAAQLSVERQVMLEAKIVEVELRDGYQSGIDWHALRNGGGATGVMGTIGGGTANNVLINGVVGNVPGLPSGSASISGALSLPAAAGGVFGLALATEGFQAVLGFLETRGDIQILSSPRIATLNNQKALLKVGTDEFFVTGFSSNTTNTGTTGTATGSNNTTINPITPVISSMFSGIALDVTPQIDEANNITLHVRPSVTSISEKSKSIGLPSGPLPLASRSVNESDTMVRIQDGNIVAIGGLMQMESNRSASGLPGSTNSSPFLSGLLGNKANTGRKKELVVLIKPTIIRSAEDWEAQTRRSRAALDEMDATRARIVRVDGATEK